MGENDSPLIIVWERVGLSHVGVDYLQPRPCTRPLRAEMEVEIADQGSDGLEDLSFLGMDTQRRAGGMWGEVGLVK